MTDIQVIEPARNKYFARPEHRDPPRAMVNSTRAGHTLSEGSARTVARIGQLWEGPVGCVPLVAACKERRGRSSSRALGAA
jgi:hypothetical protein